MSFDRRLRACLAAMLLAWVLMPSPVLSQGVLPSIGVDHAEVSCDDGSVLVIEVLTSHASCDGTSVPGSAAVHPSGGTAPYTITWDCNASCKTCGDSVCALGVEAGTCTLQVTDANGCTLVHEVIIHPAGSLRLDVDAAPATCGSPGTATVHASGGTPPFTYLWNDPAAQTTATATDLAPGTYTVTVFDASGPDSCSSAATVVVGEIDFELQVSPDQELCRGDSVQLLATGTPGMEFLWSPDDGSLSCTDCPDPTASPETTTTYTVRASHPDCSGQPPITAEVTVTVNGTQPTLVAEVPTVCAGGSVRLLATGGVTYQWRGPGTFSCLDCPTPFFQPAGGSATVSVLVTDTFGCEHLLEQKILVSGTLEVKAPDDLVVCPGEPVVLETTVQGKVEGPVEYLWSPTAGLTCSRCPAPTASVSQPTTYEVSVFADGCSASDQVTIRLDKIFGASLVAHVDAEPPGQVRFHAEPKDADATYRWDFGDGDQIVGQGGSFSQPVHVYQASGRYQVCLTLENRCGSHTVCELVTVEGVPCETCDSCQTCDPKEGS